MEVEASFHCSWVWGEVGPLTWMEWNYWIRPEEVPDLQKTHTSALWTLLLPDSCPTWGWDPSCCTRDLLCGALRAQGGATSTHITDI